MSLTSDDRKALVVYRIEKAYAALDEAQKWHQYRCGT